MPTTMTSESGTALKSSDKFVRVDVEGGLYECDWTAACLDLAGEGADRVGVVQWFTSHGPSMAQVAAGGVPRL